MNPHNPNPLIFEDPDEGPNTAVKRPARHRPGWKGTALAIPAIAVPFLLIIAVGAGALRWASTDEPDLVQAAPAAGAESLAAAAPEDPVARPNALVSDGEDEEGDDVEAIDDADEDGEGDDADPEDGDDDLGAEDEDDGFGDARTQCAAVLEELLLREERGEFSEPSEDDDISEEELETIEIPEDEFDGSVDDPDEDGELDDEGDDRDDDFGEELEFESLSNAELVRGVDACFEAGILEDDEEHEGDEDGEADEDEGEGEDDDPDADEESDDDD